MYSLIGCKMCRTDISLSGKVAIVTGSNTGIGLETAKGLFERGATVIMACRDMVRAEQARDKILIDLPGLDGSHLTTAHIDLSSLESIKQFADNIIQQHEKIHILVNNAGVMWCSKQFTKDGIELQFGVNHIGHFYLTTLLLDVLKSSAPSRIVTVSSLLHYYGKIDFDNLCAQKSYNRFRAYNDSKIANVFFTKELSRRLAGTGVTVYSLNPGFVNTELLRNFVGLNFFLKWWCYLSTYAFGKTAVQGAQTSLMCAIDPDLDNNSGNYFSDCKGMEPVAASQDLELTKKLWEVSEEMINTALKTPQKEIE